MARWVQSFSDVACLLYIPTVNEEYIKALSTEQLVNYAVSLLELHLALAKKADNPELLKHNREMLTMIHAELESRNAR